MSFRIKKKKIKGDDSFELYPTLSHSSLSLSIQKTKVFVWTSIPWWLIPCCITMLKTFWEILKLVKYTLPLYETILLALILKWIRWLSQFENIFVLIYLVYHDGKLLRRRGGLSRLKKKKNKKKIKVPILFNKSTVSCFFGDHGKTHTWYKHKLSHLYENFFSKD